MFKRPERLAIQKLDPSIEAHNQHLLAVASERKKLVDAHTQALNKINNPRERFKKREEFTGLVLGKLLNIAEVCMSDPGKRKTLIQISLGIFNSFDLNVESREFLEKFIELARSSLGEEDKQSLRHAFNDWIYVKNFH